jgi:hypothetical protein
MALTPRYYHFSFYSLAIIGCRVEDCPFSCGRLWSPKRITNKTFRIEFTFTKAVPISTQACNYLRSSASGKATLENLVRISRIVNFKRPRHWPNGYSRLCMYRWVEYQKGIRIPWCPKTSHLIAIRPAWIGYLVAGKATKGIWIGALIALDSGAATRHARYFVWREELTLSAEWLHEAHLSRSLPCV